MYMCMCMCMHMHMYMYHDSGKINRGVNPGLMPGNGGQLETSL